MKECKEKRCSICGKKRPDWMFETVEVTYSVNGQVILRSKKSMCPNCVAKVAIGLSDTSMFPAKGKRAKYDPIPHHDPNGGLCPDCSAADGEYHKPGCDWERCPVCGLQLLSCGHGDQVRVLIGKAVKAPEQSDRSDKMNFTPEVCMEMYDALKALTDGLNHEFSISDLKKFEPYLKKAEQALKKARGEK